MGFITAAIIAGSVALGAGAGVAISKAAGGSKGGGGAAPAVQKPEPLPAAPMVSEQADAARKQITARRKSATQTIYSSPLGATGEAAVARKKLLGE